MSDSTRLLDIIDADPGPPAGQAFGEPNDPTASGLRVTTADLSRSRPPRWAWQGRIVIGYLNLLLGNEGVGKGTLTAWLIARLTRGELPGDFRGNPIGVGVIGDEDSFDGVWTPRLHANGADLARVVQIERPDGGFVDLRADRDKLRKVIKAERIEFLYLDQMLDNLGVGVDDWRQKPVRDGLQPGRSLARELDIALLGSLHPNKRADSFRTLVAGSSAFNAVSRSSLLLAQHPEDEDVRVLVRGKGNLSQKPKPVEFRLGEHRFEANGHEFKVPVATKFAIGELSVDDLLSKDVDREHSSDTKDATGIITALLPRDGEWHPAKRLIEACEENGIDKRTAQRAAQRLKLAQGWTKTFPAESLWKWPSDDTGASRKNDVAPVAPVAPANSAKPLRGSSDDTHDSDDIENTRRTCVAPAETPEGWTDQELFDRQGGLS